MGLGQDIAFTGGTPKEGRDWPTRDCIAASGQQLTDNRQEPGNRQELATAAIALRLCIRCVRLITGRLRLTPAPPAPPVLSLGSLLCLSLSSESEVLDDSPSPLSSPSVGSLNGVGDRKVSFANFSGVAMHLLLR